MTRRASQALVACILVALAFVLRGRSRLPETPEAAVSAFFEAAARGDADAYLALTAGDLERSLEETRAGLGSEAFRRELERSSKGVKGIAVTRRDDSPTGYLAVDVEIIFADRNERQRLLLREKGAGWAIESMDRAERIEPPIPYGTPVYEAEPKASANGAGAKASE